MQAPIKSTARIIAAFAGVLALVGTLSGVAWAESDERHYASGKYRHDGQRAAGFNYGNQIQGYRGGDRAIHKGRIEPKYQRDGHGGGHRDGHRDGYRSGGGHKHAKRDAYRHGHRYGHRHGYRHGGHRGKHYAGHFRGFKFHGPIRARGYGPNCHRVSKIGYFHGRKAYIGGTGCYDRYGAFYVIPGSRYVINYIYY